MTNLDSQEAKLHVTETPRSRFWPSVRLAHLRLEPYCKSCGNTVDLEVHHIEPFHLHPEKELDPGNLITLCEEVSKEHHLHVGHLGNWKSFNPDVRAQAAFVPSLA